MRFCTYELVHAASTDNNHPPALSTALQWQEAYQDLSTWGLEGTAIPLPSQEV